MKITAGIEQHVRISGAGRRIVFVHGVGSHLESWDGVVAVLGESYESLCYDLRGHGESEKASGPYSLATFVEDLTGLLNVVGWTRFDLVGFSLGGLIAQAFTLQYPAHVRTLSIISSVAGRTSEERARVRSRAATLAQQGAQAHLDSAVERWFSDEFRAVRPDVVAQRLDRSRSNDPHCYAAAYDVLAANDLLDDLHKIKAPTLVMTGEEDSGSTPRMAHLMGRTIPNAKVTILSGLRHSVLLEAPDLVAQTLGNFLELHKEI
jgi:(E)-2-((N-methylformamido)methylene)succinate hydrolase